MEQYVGEMAYGSQGIVDIIVISDTDENESEREEGRQVHDVILISSESESEESGTEKSDSNRVFDTEEKNERERKVRSLKSESATAISLLGKVKGSNRQGRMVMMNGNRAMRQEEVVRT